MNIELKPEQAALLERARQRGLTSEDLLDQAFAIIQDHLDQKDWMIEDREAIAAHIEEGVQQAQRGELIEGEDVVRMLRERRARREVA